MGTPAITIVLDEENRELLSIYSQSDGYPDSHGVNLAELCDRTIRQGYGFEDTMQTAANGMQCLAAQLVAGLKTRIGGTYILPPNSNWDAAYTYIVSFQGVGKKPRIACRKGSETRTRRIAEPAKFAAWAKKTAA